MGLRSIIKHDHVRVEEALAESTPSRPGSRRGAQRELCVVEASARVLEIEGRAHAIEVTCGCGEVIVVELAYGTESPDPS